MIRAALFALALLLVCSCGPKSITARREHSQHLADEADEELSAAERAMQELEPDEAGKRLEGARKLLQDSDASLYPEYEMLLGRAKEDDAKLPDVRRAREQRDLQATIAKRRAVVDEQVARVKKAVKALEPPGVDTSAVKEATEAASALLDALKDGIDLEPKDKAYNEYAKKQRAEFEKAKEPIQLARARVEYMEGPAALRDQAAEKLKAGKAAKKDDEKRPLFAAAKKLYEQCQEASRKALMANPGVSRLAITAGGRKTTPEALDTACSAEWQDVDKAEKKLKPEKKPKKK